MCWLLLRVVTILSASGTGLMKWPDRLNKARCWQFKQLNSTSNWIVSGDKKFIHCTNEVIPWYTTTYWEYTWNRALLLLLHNCLFFDMMSFYKIVNKTCDSFTDISVILSETIVVKYMTSISCNLYTIIRQTFVKFYPQIKSKATHYFLLTGKQAIKLNNKLHTFVFM